VADSGPSSAPPLAPTGESGRGPSRPPPEPGRELARSLPAADFVLVDAGHTPVFETPDAVAACVRDVLRRAGE
jgi:pimeloyl-ACP methyl ester carboxylesterase